MSIRQKMNELRRVVRERAEKGESERRQSPRPCGPPPDFAEGGTGFVCIEGIGGCVFLPELDA